MGGENGNGRCDEVADCQDGSDELNCDAVCVEDADCPDAGQVCQDGACVDGQANVCVPECANGQACVGSECVADPDACQGFLCGDDVCIDAQEQCDGTNDCVDNSDEAGVGAVSSLSAQTRSPVRTVKSA